MPPLVDTITEAFAQGAVRVVLESGQPPLAELDRGMEPVGGEVADEALFEFVASVVDEDRMAELALGNVIETTVDLSGIAAVLSVDPRPDGIVAVVRPATSEAATAPSRPPPAEGPPHLAPLELPDDDSAPPEGASASGGSWLPMDLDVDTGEIELGPEGEDSGAFPSELPDGVASVATSPSSDALPRVDATAPTRADVPVVGLDDAADPGASTARDTPLVEEEPAAHPGDSGAADRGASTAREVPLVDDAPAEPSQDSDVADPGAATARDTPLVDESPAAPVGADDSAPGPGGEPADPSHDEEASAGLRGAAPVGATGGVAGGARATDTVGTFADLASLIEPGRIVFVRFATPPGEVGAADLAAAVAARRGSCAHVLDRPDDDAAWARAEREAAAGGVVVVDLLDPSVRARDILRMVESEALVFVVTRARSSEGARRVLAASGGEWIVQWIEAVGTGWIALTSDGWQLS